MTAEEVCGALKISKRALQYYRQQEIIPYTAIGNKIFFRESDIQRILTSNLIKSAE